MTCLSARGAHPLHAAAPKGHLKIAKLILQNGADVLSRFPMHVATNNGHRHILRSSGKLVIAQNDQSLEKRNHDS